MMKRIMLTYIECTNIKVDISTGTQNFIHIFVGPAGDTTTILATHVEKAEHLYAVIPAPPLFISTATIHR